MKKNIIILSCLFIAQIMAAQSIESALNAIENYDDVRAFKKANVDLYIEQFYLNTGDELDVLQQKVLSLLDTSLFELNGYWYKILDKKTYTGSRVRYIYLDGNKWDYAKIDSVRNVIIQKYEANPTEENYINLVKTYNMDGNKNGGDLGWYNPSNMVKPFSQTVFGHKKGDIFKIDISENKWYYVVLKSEEEKKVTSLSYLVVNKKG
jgi:hypothetical protein